MSLEGLILATDGTMADYCDILRGHSAADVMSIEVLRFDTEEVLEGQLNGQVLEQSFSFAAASIPYGAMVSRGRATSATAVQVSGVSKPIAQNTTPPMRSSRARSTRERTPVASM